jgi:hypothetical protein
MILTRTKLWGILTVIFWLLSIAYVLQYPLKTWLMIGWQFYVGLVILFIGLASGILLLVHPQSGKIIAISLSAMIIIWRLWHYASSFSQIGDRLYALYVINMRQHPIQVVYFDILGYVFWACSIIYLSKKEPVAD